jgi:hypothetical protein
MALEDPSDEGPLAVLRDGLARNGPFASHAKMGATLPVDRRSAVSAHAAVGARDLAEIRAGPDSATRLMRRGLMGSASVP